MRLRMLLAALGLLALAACGESPTGANANGPTRPAFGGYMGSGD
jgi:hypothetical protein